VEADLCLLEVGLGGSLDATNVLERPALSVIAPVDHDHREFLGDTITAIAGEKAGIIKRGAPVVVGRQCEEAFAVIEARAMALGAPLTAMGVEFDAWSERGRLIVQTPDRLLDLPLPSLAGPHQIDNAGLAVMAALQLPEARIDGDAISRGIASTVWPARMQRLTRGPFGERAQAAGADLWLDGGHNPHAAAALARTIGDMAARDGRPVTVICGLLANKDADGFFAAFRDLQPRIIAVPFEADTASPPARLVEAAARAGLKAGISGSALEALETVLAGDGPPPHVVICGSLYLAGEVLAASKETWPT
jgi:dihydrofolate synthase/folylpolyglutamate synthase